MRFPIKFQSEVLPPVLRRCLPHKPSPLPLLGVSLDEETFSRCVSSICVDGVWKTTKPARHEVTNAHLLRRLAGRTCLRVLDVGVSDGVTAADLAASLAPQLSAYYATDLYLALDAVERRGAWHFFRAGRQTSAMVVTRRLIYYRAAEAENAFRRWIDRRSTDVLEAERPQRVSLVSPKLRALIDAGVPVQLAEWDVFEPWTREKMDVVRAANILNPAYFNPDRLRIALARLRDALVEGGLLFIVDNRPAEKGSLLRREGEGFRLVDRVGTGCDIESLSLA